MTRVTNKVHRARVLEALHAFYERQKAHGPSCPKRPGRPHRFSGYPRESARCWFCGALRSEA